MAAVSWANALSTLHIYQDNGTLSNTLKCVVQTYVVLDMPRMVLLAFHHYLTTSMVVSLQCSKLQANVDGQRVGVDIIA